MNKAITVRAVVNLSIRSLRAGEVVEMIRDDHVQMLLDKGYLVEVSEPAAIDRPLPPPRNGETEEWRAYAREMDYEPQPDAGREEIINFLDENGVPTSRE